MPATEPHPPEARLVDGQTVRIVFLRHPQARFYRLTLQRDGVFRCTIPQRGSRPEAEAFVVRHHPWMLARLQARATRPGTPLEWRLGTPVWFRGEPIEITHAQDGPFLQLGPLRIPQPLPDETNLRPRIEAALRAMARVELPPRTRELASIHKLKVNAVHVRNQRSRWGSCSGRKTISLNWRLIQLPPEIADYIILHELAHLTHLNHSERFWEEVARLYPDYPFAEHWLKTHGERLL
jgi:predicted metal-dependent hydrolase